MYVKLAFGNVRKSARDYTLYFVTVMFVVALLYAFNTVGTQVDMLPQASKVVESTGELLGFLSIAIMAVFTFLVVYANNFLIRRRVKELALYQVLGMRRRHVAIILTLETFFSSLAALVIGLLLGVVMSQFFVFVTAWIMETTVHNYHFVFTASAFIKTIMVFFGIFVLTLLVNVITLGRLRLVELMKHGVKNEVSRVRSIGVSFVLFVIGVVMIGFSYWDLHRTGYPFFPSSRVSEEQWVQAWMHFWVTTLIVVVGTYVVFYSLGGMLMYFARSSKRFYWRGLNMFTVRELASKINTSAMSMASVSIVIFLMLGVVTTAFGVSRSVNEGLEKYAPHDATFSMFVNTAEDEFNSEASAQVLIDEGIVSNAVEKDGVWHGDFEGHKAAWVVGVTYQHFVWQGVKELSPSDPLYIPSLKDVAKAADFDLSTWDADMSALIDDTTSMRVMSVSDYNKRRILCGEQALQVGDNEYAISFSSSTPADEVYNVVLGKKTPVTVFGHTLTPADEQIDESKVAVFANDATGINSGTLIVPDAIIPAFDTTRDEEIITDGFVFDIVGVIDFDKPNDAAYFVDDSGEIQEIETASVFVHTAQSVVEESLGLKMLVTYIAIYTGFILIVVTAAILAIQMMTHTQDGLERYQRLRDIGCSQRMQNGSVATQMLAFFVLPLLVAVSHAAVAVGVLNSMVKHVLPMSISYAVIVTGVFVLVIYGVYYMVTYAGVTSLISNHTEKHD